MVLKIRATIPESKVFFKVYAVRDDMNLFAFNSFIIGDLCFAPDQMVTFQAFDQQGTLCSEYALFDLGDGSMDKITFAAVMAKGEEELHFIYDIRNGRYIRIVFDGESPETPLKLCPCLLEEKGHAPDQFNTHYEDYEAVAAPGVFKHVPADDDDLDDDLDDDDEEDDELDEDDDEDGKEIYDEEEGN